MDNVGAALVQLCVQSQQSDLRDTARLSVVFVGRGVSRDSGSLHVAERWSPDGVPRTCYNRRCSSGQRGCPSLGVTGYYYRAVGNHVSAANQTLHVDPAGVSAPAAPGVEGGGSTAVGVDEKSDRDAMGESCSMGGYILRRPEVSLDGMAERAHAEVQRPGVCAGRAAASGSSVRCTVGTGLWVPK